MVDACVAPSELHLKKELTALQKARFLRDPQTCSSWRSPLSSKSFTTNNLNFGNVNSGEKITGKILGESSSENIQKKIYLYNWRQHSSKSIKLDEEGSHASVNNNSLEASTNINNIRGRNAETKVRRKVKKSRNSVSKKKTTNHSAVTKLLDLSSTIEPSSDTDYCNSDDLLQLTHVLTNKMGNHSPSVSPLFSGSGCGNWSYSSKILRNNRKEGSSNSCTPASTNSYYRYRGQNTSVIESWDGTTTSIDGDELDQIDLLRNQGCGIPCYWPKKNKERSRGDFNSPSLSDTLRRKGSSLLCGSQTRYSKKRLSQGMPLLSSSGDEGSSLDTVSDEISVNCGELELEALSRLDGRRWSNCKSHDGLQSVPSTEADIDTIDHKTLSQKYIPKYFDEIIGQNIVVHSLNNAIQRRRIAPAYLFQGPRGTGKTSTARIFAAALNCLSNEDKKPCGHCRECTSIFSGHGSNVKEVDAINKKGIDKISFLLKNISLAKTVSRYKILIIDECHMLSSRMWAAFMNFLQDPPSHLVLIFVTIDPDSLPRVMMSRCQKFIFSKVKDVDIVSRLRKLSYDENLEIELDALDLIALNSDGSLRDAETMLEQLSLLGKRITTSLVNELIGVVSDDKLLDLLEIAMSSDTSETVKRSRELMDSGVDPVALMSQLAALIMDIIAGTNQMATSQLSGVALGEQSLSEDELKRLQQALKILSDAEKQLRHSSERSTWFTAALLQLGSNHNSDITQSSNSSKHSLEISDAIHNMDKDSSFSISKTTSEYSSRHSCSSSYKFSKNKKLTSDKLALIWRRCIQKCQSDTLRELLNSHGKLVSISDIERTLIACIVFEDTNAKSKAERYLSIITNSLQQVLQHNVEIRISFMPANHNQKGNVEAAAIDEHKLEYAWLQASDKTSLELASQSNPNRNQVLPQNGVDCETNKMSSKQWEDELNYGTRALKINDNHSLVKKQIGGSIDLNSMSPSLLHSSGFKENFDKESMGYESGRGCSALFCWKPHKKSYNAKAKKGFHAQSPKTPRIHCLGNIRGRRNQETK